MRLPLLSLPRVSLRSATVYTVSFFVRKVLRVDDSEVTPSHTFEDGKDYVPTKSG